MKIFTYFNKKTFGLFVFILGLMILPKISLAEASLIVKESKGDLVTLEASGLSVNIVRFELWEHNTNAPSIEFEPVQTTVNSSGVATMEFGGLESGKNYKAFLSDINNPVPYLATLDFTFTPSSGGGGANLTYSNYTGTAVTLIADGLIPSPLGGAKFYISPSEKNPSNITIDAQEKTSEIFPGGHAEVDFTGLNPTTNYSAYVVYEDTGVDPAGLIEVPSPPLPYTPTPGSGGPSGGGPSGGGGFKSLASPEGGFMPKCPSDRGCGFDELLGVINKIVSFALTIAIPIAAIMFAYAGFLLVTSGGEAARKTTAKKIFLNAALGIVFIAGAWLIIHTILVVVGYNQDFNWFGF